jgi:YegS/Rv2252/BmrU family lipid kinase
MTDSSADGAGTVLVMNPESGSGRHSRAVRERAKILDYDVFETERPEHAIELAQTAVVEGADAIVAVGGDGTLNEVVRGVYEAGGSADVTVGVVPTGTGNAFAGNVGITDIDDGFQAVMDGRRRRLDVGLADDRPFVNSCLVGIKAEASDATPDEMKSKYGVLAYVIETVKTAPEFTGIDLTASTGEGGHSETVWEGEAIFVLVGNGNRFTRSGSQQANIEDGRLDVTIIEDVDSVSLVKDHLVERLFDHESEHITRLLAESLEMSIGGDDPVSFSLDGEIVYAASMELTTRPRSLRMAVGDGYDPDPGDD